MSDTETQAARAAQDAQMRMDGPHQDAQLARVQVGTEVVFTYGADERGWRPMVAAKFIRQNPNGEWVLLVHGHLSDGAYAPYTMTMAYFSSAKPGTVGAERCWGWPEGGLR